MVDNDNIVLPEYLYITVIQIDDLVATCTCKPTKTCTPTGCFISTSCLTLTCKLKDDRVSTDDIQIKFRIVQALNENQIIIGLNEVQEHDLTKVFRHLYIKKQDVSHEIEEPKNENTRSIPLSPDQLNSASHEEGNIEGGQPKKASKNTKTGREGGR